MELPVLVAATVRKTGPKLMLNVVLAKLLMLSFNRMICEDISFVVSAFI